MNQPLHALESTGHHDKLMGNFRARWPNHGRGHQETLDHLAGEQRLDVAPDPQPLPERDLGTAAPHQADPRLNALVWSPCKRTSGWVQFDRV